MRKPLDLRWWPAPCTPDLVAGDAWSDFLPGSKDLEADWVGKKCGNFNTKTGKCGGQGS